MILNRFTKIFLNNPSLIRQLRVDYPFTISKGKVFGRSKKIEVERGIQQKPSFFKNKSNKKTLDSDNLKPKPDTLHIKKQELDEMRVNNHQKIKTNEQLNLAKIIAESQNLQTLLQNKQKIFQQQTHLVPFYLDLLTKHLTKQKYQKYEKEFNFINRLLNQTSLELSVSPLQYITIVNYRYECQKLQKAYNQSANFIFQRKAMIACATFIHKKQLQFNQCIFVLEALMHLGSTNVLLFMNLIKYFKHIFNEEKHLQKIQLEQLITILNIGFIKRNQITLENIFYDQVLNYLLNNMNYYMKEKSILIKMQVLNIFLVIDIKRFYKSDRFLKQQWIKKLLNDVIQEIDDSWAKQLLVKQNKEFNNSQMKANWKHILLLIENINFVRENKLEAECYQKEFYKIINKIFNNFFMAISEVFRLNEQYRFEGLQQQKSSIMRLLFTSSIWRRWIVNEKEKEIIERLILRLKITRQSSFYPLVDAINPLLKNKDNQKFIFASLMGIAREIYKESKSYNLIIWPLVAIFLETSTQAYVLKLIKELSKVRESIKTEQQPILSYMFLLIHYGPQYQLNKLQLSSDNFKKIEHQFSDTGLFIHRIYDSVMNFRKVQVVDATLQYFCKSFSELRNYMVSLKTKKDLNEEWILIFNLLMMTRCNKNDQKLDPLLEQLFQQLLKIEIIRHQFLVQIYPEEFPHPNRYNKKVNILSDPETFQRNFTIIMKYLQNQKYSYFFWDIFIKHYVKLPVQIKQNCFDLLQKVFWVAFEKQNLRKIVLLTVLTNHFSGNTIVGDKQNLKKLFERCVLDLVKSQQVIEYHYQCYLDVVVNALSCDILSDDMFQIIMNHTFDKSPQIKNTCSLMLLYGAVLSNNQEKLKSSQRNVEMVRHQQNYLKSLVRNKNIILKDINDSQSGHEQSKSQHSRKSFNVSISGKVISIFLRFGTLDILGIKEIILRFIRQQCSYAQWMLIAYSYDGSRYSQSKGEQVELVKGMSEAMLLRLQELRSSKMRTKQHELLVDKFK